MITINNSIIKINSKQYIINSLDEEYKISIHSIISDVLKENDSEFFSYININSEMFSISSPNKRLMKKWNDQKGDLEKKYLSLQKNLEKLK
jgi:hypothetical protein